MQINHKVNRRNNENQNIKKIGNKKQKNMLKLAI